MNKIDPTLQSLSQFSQSVDVSVLQLTFTAANL